MGSLSPKIPELERQETPMELRLFKMLCLAAAALTFCVIVPVELLIRLPYRIPLLDLCFGVTALIFYRQACRGRYLVKSLFFLYLLNLNLSWFANNGSHGSLSLFFFTAFIYALIFFRGSQRLILLSLAVTDVMALILSELFYEQWLIPYQSQSARVGDLVLGVAVSALSCSLMLRAVLSSYDREQRRLSRLNDELELMMAERREAEHSLSQNRELLHAVIEGTSDAVYAKDTEGRYILFNSGAARITGRRAQQALGKDDSLLFPWDEARCVMEKDREILSSGEILHLEHTLTNGCGEKIVVQETKGPLRNEAGGIIGVFGISRDVTENRRAEDEIRKLNAELDLRITERTARLRVAIQEQESFSYSVSHDLRAPLRHINSYSAILAEECGECLTPEAHGYLDRIRYCSSTMGKLIDDLLELSRIGRSQVLKTEVDLSELARGIASGLQEAHPLRQVECIVAPDLRAHGDRILLQQALVNLLDNAWKYTGLRQSARIEVGRLEKGGQEVYFVKDNGVGFDMAYQDKLFGAFQRLHGAEFEGTGIGLATVKRIIKRHGGRVWAEGVVDQGATVYFTLPGKAGGSGEQVAGDVDALQ
jgi:PAS domain S-box-containing protein